MEETRGRTAKGRLRQRSKNKLDREKEGKEAQGEGDTLISGNYYHLHTLFHQAVAHTFTLSRWMWASKQAYEVMMNPAY